MITIAAATVLAGCDTLNALANGVLHPMTPQQSRSQVVDAAAEVSLLIAKPIESAYFWHGSCSDGDQGPFRVGSESPIARPLTPGLRRRSSRT